MMFSAVEIWSRKGALGFLESLMKEFLFEQYLQGTELESGFVNVSWIHFFGMWEYVH